MKRSVAISLLVSVGFIAVSPAFAVTITPTSSANPVTTTTTAEKVTTTTTTTNKSSGQLTNLQSRAVQELDRRIAALQEVLKKITEMKKLSAAEKTTLTTQVQAEVTNLTNLKTKIQAATDITALKADVASITSQYRIFALYIPKIHLLATADVLGATIDRLTILSGKLEARITAAESAGMSVTKLQATHTSMNDKIAEAKKQYESIITNVTPLDPDGYPGNKSTLTNARGLVTTARRNLVGAQQDARTILTSLKAYRPTENNKSATSSASPAATTPAATAPTATTSAQ